MKRVVLSGVLLCLIFAVLAGCGGSKNSSTSTAVTVTLSPTAASVSTGQTQQFTATVANTTNTAVNWTVNGLAGGNQTVGFVSSTGLYSAPNSVPTPATVTVAAISQAETSATGSATVTITAPATPAAALVVSPQSVTVPAGAQQTFSATVSGSAIAVNWTLNCQSAAAGTCGTIDANGLYTAPAAPPPGANVTVTATAKDNSVPASAAVVTVEFGNGTLNGKYAFTFFGRLAGVSYVAAGSITFDGNGNITGGSMDVNSGGAAPVAITGGSYHILTDGRGNAALSVTPGGTMNWQFVVVNHSRAFVSRFDSGVQSASGTLDLQDASQFTAASFSGNYAYNFSGADSSGKPATIAIAGAVTSDGISAVSGAIEENDAGTSQGVQTVSGNYVFTAPSGAGRGTLTFNSVYGSRTLIYYVVDGTHLKAVGSDSSAQIVGEFYKQPAGPFTKASLRGSYVFALLGSDSSGPVGEGGVLTLDGNGNVSGTMDVNRNGTPQKALVVTGTYPLVEATIGRTILLLTVGGTSYEFFAYPQINGAFSLVQIDSTHTPAAGRALLQPAASFGSGSLVGNYALNLSGTSFTAAATEEDVIGKAVPNGGSVIAGTLDTNNGGVLATSQTISTGSYSCDSLCATTGRGGPASLGTSAFTPAGGFNFYIVDSNTILFLETDSSRVLVGLMQKQF